MWTVWPVALRAGWGHRWSAGLLVVDLNELVFFLRRCAGAAGHH